MFFVKTQNEKTCWTTSKERTTLSTLLSRMPFRTGPQNGEEVEDEMEDEAFHAKYEIKSTVLGGQGGDLNKIRKSRQITSTMIPGAEGEEGEEDQEDGVVREVGAVQEVEQEVEGASDPGKRGG
jgi:hypothetical protein